MARMNAVDAAVLVLEREGVSVAFGVPGAAINPFYAALRKRGAVRHILARHVEGASHMADGYTRAKPGNIGVCIGTSGPGGTDMITGLYAAAADSVPILCITPKIETARRLSMVWGVHAVVSPDISSFAEMVQKACRIAHAEHIANAGERVVITAGVPFGTPGATNILRIAWIHE